MVVVGTLSYDRLVANVTGTCLVIKRNNKRSGYFNCVRLTYTDKVFCNIYEPLPYIETLLLHCISRQLIGPRK